MAVPQLTFAVEAFRQETCGRPDLSPQSPKFFGQGQLQLGFVQQVSCQLMVYSYDLLCASYGSLAILWPLILWGYNHHPATKMDPWKDNCPRKIADSQGQTVGWRGGKSH